MRSARAWTATFRPRDAGGGTIDVPPFVPDPDGQREVFTNGLWMALCADLAYVRDTADLQARLAEAGFEGVRCFDRAGTQGFVARHPNDGRGVHVLAFRGTEEPRDFVTDMHILFREVVAGEARFRCHAGFERALDEVWGADGSAPSAIDAVRALAAAHPGEPWFLTGHSLGGALALVAARRMIADDALPAPHAVYTIGSPRIGDRALARHLTAATSIHRFVHESDTVPRVPPAFLLLPFASYRHSGTEYWLRRKRDLVTSARSSFPARLRWISTAYDELYAFAMIGVVGLIVALVIVQVVNTAVRPLGLAAALGLAAVLWAALMLASVKITAAVRHRRLVRRLGVQAIGDHGASRYVAAIRARVDASVATDAREVPAG